MCAFDKPSQPIKKATRSWRASLLGACWALVGLWLLFGNVTVQAAPVPPKGQACDADGVCARLAEKAYEASQLGHFEDAVRFYDQAYQRRPDSKLLFNLARVLHKAGRLELAESYYQKYLDVGAEGNDIQRRKVEGYLVQIKAESGSVPVAPAAAAPASFESSSSKTPLYRKWWLWTAVGVAAAGLAVGIGVGVAARRPDLTGAFEVRPLFH